MAVKKIIISTIPNRNVRHFFQLENAAPISATIGELSRNAFYEGKIISLTKYKDILTVRTEVVWATREDSDANDALLFAIHPEYVSARDTYNANNGITWTITYEDV